MLVLTRKMDESFVINDCITITILAIEGEKVKIGISAPRDIPILRKELWDAVNDQNRIAAALASMVEPVTFQTLRDFLVTENEEETSDSSEPVEPPSNEFVAP